MPFNTTENELADPQAHTEGPLNTTEHVFAGPQAHTEGSLTTTEHVFAGPQAHSEGPLSTTEHVFAGPHAHMAHSLQPKMCLQVLRRTYRRLNFSTERVFAGPLAHTVLTFEHVFASHLIKLKAFCSFVFPSSTEVSFWIL